MSFNIRCDIPARATPAKVVDIVLQAEATGNDNAPKEKAELIGTAAGLVAHAVTSGKLGSPRSNGFHVSVDGHVNQGHKPGEVWSGAFLSISIAQVKQVQPEPAAKPAAAPKARK